MVLAGVVEIVVFLSLPQASVLTRVPQASYTACALDLAIGESARRAPRCDDFDRERDEQARV